MSKIINDLVTNEEMNDFITDLFNVTNPKVDTDWDLTLPEISSVDGQDVEFVTDTEVKNFISGLFQKE